LAAGQQPGASDKILQILENIDENIAASVMQDYVSNNIFTKTDDSEDIALKKFMGHLERVVGTDTKLESVTRFQKFEPHLRRPGESVHNFIIQWEANLVQPLPFPRPSEESNPQLDQYLAQKLLKDVSLPDLSQAISQLTKEYFFTFRKVCDVLKRVFGTLTEVSGSLSAIRTFLSQKREVRCWKCNATGHINRNCHVPCDTFERFSTSRVLSVRSRPDIICSVVKLSRKMSKPQRIDLDRAMRVLQYARRTRDIGLNFIRLNIDTVEILVIFDASPFTENEAGQEGILVLLIDDRRNVNILTWISRKINRVHVGSLGAESFALISSIDQAVTAQELMLNILGKKLNVQLVTDCHSL